MTAPVFEPPLPTPPLLLAPPPKTYDEYIARFARTWKVLRGGGSFPLDEARDRERAERTFARGLNPDRASQGGAAGRSQALILLLYPLGEGIKPVVPGAYLAPPVLTPAQAAARMAGEQPHLALAV